MKALCHLLVIIVIALQLSACADPCNTSLSYGVGTLDERFRATRGEVLTALRQAEALWEDASQRNLFQYDRNARVRVNFIYDDRQKTAQSNARRQQAIESQDDAADQMRREIDRTKDKLEIAERAYRDAAASFETRLPSHNRTVAQWNSRGGAPESVREALEREAAELKSLTAALDTQRRKLNALVERVNSLTERYNVLVVKINSDIDAVNATAGWEFNQGRFVSDADGARIEVYEYVDRDDLVHVLAHELGHALGLDHNENPESVMYGNSASKTFRLTAEDVAALRARCGG